MSRYQARCDAGFTLIEILVVMIVVGLLAAIATPTCFIQRAQAHDSSTKTGVSTVGKEVATYHIHGAGPLTPDTASIPGSMVVSDGRWSTTVNVTHGIAFPTTGARTALDDPNGWCVSLTNPGGRLQDFKYSAMNGLEAGTC